MKLSMVGVAVLSGRKRSFVSEKCVMKARSVAAKADESGEGFFQSHFVSNV